MKKALQLTGKVNMIDQFCIPNIKLLQSLGYSVSVVSDFSDPGSITMERSEDLKRRLSDMDVQINDVSIPRSLSFRKVFSAYKETKRLIEKEKYELIHCHSPIGAAVCRMAAKEARKNGTQVIYTAHGFHFYKGAPIKNWVIYYIAEKILSIYTDVLITINKEDFERAKKRLNAGRVLYVPGIGVDTDRFNPEAGNKDRIRSELNLSSTQTMLLSVGELNKNKNHERVINAIKGMDIVYVIVGKGVLKERLEQVAKRNGVDLRLMGYRSDVSDFYAASDLYILPSIREGLNVSLMEAMASGVPVTCGGIRGNTDLVDRPLFNPNNTDEIRNAIEIALREGDSLVSKNLERIKGFDLETVNRVMKQVYMSVGENMV
ncbi:MAG: glycosyltransferase [Saccharofermentans sp.]|nr:glycosyltransferase [Saccharofermentans sp.]